MTFIYISQVKIMYTLKICGRDFSISGGVFAILFLLFCMFVLLLIAWVCLIVYLSTGMLSNYLHIPRVVCGILEFLFLGSFTINKNRYALLPSSVQTCLIACLVVWTAHYQFIVKHSSALLIGCMLTPIVLSSCSKFFASSKVD